MVINNNMSAMFANRQLGNTQLDVNRSIERLSSGMRVNRAADDASGLAVSEKMRSQIRGLNQAERNINDGISFIRTTEGNLQNSQDILQRVRELAVQSANGVYSAEDRLMIQVEVSQLVAEVDRIASQAQFNGMNMLNGSLAEGGAEGGLTLQVGANMDQNQTIFVGDMSATGLGVTGGQNGSVDLTTVESSNTAIGTLDSALMMISQQRADLGAYQNRFEFAAKGVAIAAENTQAAESRIRDTDMASQMVSYTRENILSQAGVAMLSQANVRNQAALQLLN